jgi:hypothetical protein
VSRWCLSWRQSAAGNEDEGEEKKKLSEVTESPFVFESRAYIVKSSRMYVNCSVVLSEGTEIKLVLSA